MAVRKNGATAPDANTLARAAGLARAAKQFPQDIAAAVQAAQSARSAAGAIDQVAAEPWPPMRVRDAK